MFSICRKSHVNHDKIRKHSEIIIKIKSLVNKYNWKGINVPSGKDG